MPKTKPPFLPRSKLGIPLKLFYKSIFSKCELWFIFSIQCVFTTSQDRAHAQCHHQSYSSAPLAKAWCVQSHHAANDGSHTVDAMPVTPGFNRRPVKVVYTTFFSYCNVPMVEWSGRSAHCRSTLVQIRLSALDAWTRFLMLMTPAFIWYVGHLEPSLVEGVPTCSLDLTFLCSS